MEVLEVLLVLVEGLVVAKNKTAALLGAQNGIRRPFVYDVMYALRA